jgi:hypothetical protein
MVGGMHIVLVALFSARAAFRLCIVSYTELCMI